MLDIFYYLIKIIINGKNSFNKFLLNKFDLIFIENNIIDYKFYIIKRFLNKRI